MTKGHKIDHSQKEAALEAIKAEGTMLAAAKAAVVTVKTLNNEMLRSEVFKRRVLAAREEGYRNIADKSIELIKDYAQGRCVFCHGSKTMLIDECPYCKGTGLASGDDRTDRNRLTAAIALANWAQPGFRGVTTVQGRVDHDVRVITAVPRPKYEVIVEENKPKQIEKPKENDGDN
jgi:hypothetical protein